MVPRANPSPQPKRHLSRFSAKISRICTPLELNTALMTAAIVSHWSKAWYAFRVGLLYIYPQHFSYISYDVRPSHQTQARVQDIR